MREADAIAFIYSLCYKLCKGFKNKHMSEKVPDYSPAPGVLPEGMYGPDNFVVTNSQTGGYEAADVRGFHKVDRADMSADMQNHFKKYPGDTVFLESPVGYKAYQKDSFQKMQDTASAEREALRESLYAEAQEELEVTRPRAEFEQLSQEVVEDVGKVALDGAGILAPDMSQTPQETLAETHEPILSSSEVSQLGWLLTETARQSALYRQQGDRYIAQNDSTIAGQAYQHLERIKNGQESAEFGLVAISSILGGISSEAERFAVFDMLQRTGTLNEDDMRRVGNELWSLGQLEAIPGDEADHRKFAYAENLSRQANDELTANEGAANNKYLALMSIVHGVGSRINDRSYSNRVMDGAFGKIVDSKR